MIKELKPIQAKIVGFDFEPEGYEGEAVTITCLAHGNDIEVMSENVMIISHKHYKELLKTAK